LSSDSIILNISKVEDPDELDTRFSKFSPSSDEADNFNDIMEDFEDYNDDSADEIIEYFSDEPHEVTEESIKETFVSLSELLANKLASKSSSKTSSSPSEESEPDLVRIYRFGDFSTLERLSSILKDIYFGSNTLYKDAGNSLYYLIVNKSGHSPEEFNRICNILTEYGIRENTTASREAFFKEHFTLMIKENALQILSTL